MTDMRMYSKWLAGNMVIYGGETSMGGKGTEYFVDPANGDDTNNDGMSWDNAFASIPVAYAACTDGANDKVIYLGGATGATLAATLTWAKSYTHLIGVCAPVSTGQRARIHNETVTGVTPLMNITGSGCVFKNFYIFQGVDEAVANINVQVTGERNYFENVHFAGGGHASQAINGGASLKIDGGSECRFVHCTIGVDTILAGTGMVNLLFDGSATRNEFEDCKFLIQAGHTGAAWVEVVDATGIDRCQTFKNCVFMNPNKPAFEMLSGFLIPAGMTPPVGPLLLKDCVAYGAAKWDADDRGVLMGNMDVVAPVDLSGVAVEMVT